MRDISERELNLPTALIGELLKIATESKDIISLGPGEPDFKTPQPILDHAQKLIGKSTHYANPQGRKDFREALAKKLRKENKIKANPDEIIVTTGSQEALLLALMSALDPGEQIAIPNPAYLAYIPPTKLISAKPVFFKLSEDDGWEINPDNLKKAVNKKKTQAIVINTPSNPTGTVLSKKCLEEIADIAVENNCYIFSDETYERLIYDKKHISIGSLNGMKNYVLSLYTFSKTYAMCGFRLGYAHGPKKLIDAMTYIHPNTTICAPHLSQLLGMKALNLPNKYINAMVQEYDRRRRFIVKRLNEIGLHTKTPNGAFYAFSNIQDYAKNSLQFTKMLLKKAKVATVPGTEFGQFGEGYIRLSYATALPKIRKAMDALEKILKKK